jgi:hypothetical protein
MNVRYRVDLSQAERAELVALVSGGKQPVRRLKRMQILLAADAGVTDEGIAASVQTSGSTIYRTKKRFVEISLEAALSEEPRPGAARKLSGKEEVQLVALACSDPPKGCAALKASSPLRKSPPRPTHRSSAGAHRASHGPEASSARHAQA